MVFLTLRYHHNEIDKNGTGVDKPDGSLGNLDLLSNWGEETISNRKMIGGVFITYPCNVIMKKPHNHVKTLGH